MRQAVIAIIAIALVAMAWAESPNSGALQKAAPGVRWDRAPSVKANIFCDDKRDSVYLGYRKGEIVIGFIRAATHAVQLISFAVGANQQAAVCRLPVRIASETVDLEPDYDPNSEPIRTCRGISIEDDACDSLHLFWNDTKKQLNWWRH